MTEAIKPEGGWGPERKRAALSLTFDNFGEASDIEMGWWGDQPVGAHPAVAYLDTLVASLADVRATYFVEASNAAIYPSQLLAWRDAGHEIGIHAWRHEFWAQCSAEQRRDILARSFAAFADLGIEAVGFRPPGGAIPVEAWAEFEQAGLLYCSPLDRPGAARIGGMVSLPFRWPDVDVFMIDQRLAHIRKADSRAEAALGVAEWRTAILASLDEAIAAGEHRVVIFHPDSLRHDPARLAVLTDLIAAAKANDVWIAPARDVARFFAAEADRAIPQDTLERTVA